MKKTRFQPIDITNIQPGERVNFWKPIYQDAVSQSVSIPIIKIRGKLEGPVLGVTAAIHGDELNGMRIIHHLLSDLDVERLKGTLVCIPIVNVPAYNANQRRFTDGLDLNHVFPGKKDGRSAEQYAKAFESTLLPVIDYLVDIHTASEGRVNTMYVRADLENETARQMSLDFSPQIILHAKGGDGTLRGAARKRGIPAITVEAGNPAIIQGKMVFEGEAGLRSVMAGLGLLAESQELSREPVVCKSSKWLLTVSGGLLATHFKLFDKVKKGQLLAVTHNPFGQVVNQYKAPFNGVVIGMATNPAAVSGTRFCHLGVIGGLS